MRVFFYGLFMDEHLLAKKGIEPSETSLGFVDGYGLRIGERATLVCRPDDRVYGVMMDIAPSEATELYADDSVADYISEPVIVELMDGTRVEATCYNLPGDKITGANKDYAELLLDVATRLDFPDSYLDKIRQARM
ncbi:MAG: gamma-glutamylcyclotransferase [Gammaproteobacteria bacterium]|nr:gamma-glutamylcyclotransferase [Gammaproteobacteria bacterium]